MSRPWGLSRTSIGSNERDNVERAVEQDSLKHGTFR